MILELDGSGELEREALLAALRGTPAAAALDKSGESLFAVLRDGSLPKPAATPSVDANVKAALEALKLRDRRMNSSRCSRRWTRRFWRMRFVPRANTPFRLMSCSSPSIRTSRRSSNRWIGRRSKSATRRDFVAARLEYNARRYDAEARLNQVVANLYELQVRKANLSAARHHRRSQRFFYGMLAAQTGVIISTLAIAARQRNLLWTIAAIAGVTAIAFAAYVYVFV